MELKLWWLKKGSFAVLDAGCIAVSVGLSYLLTIHANEGQIGNSFVLGFSVLTIVCCLIGFQVFNLYEQVWRYADSRHVLLIASAVTAGCGMSSMISILLWGNEVPWGFMIMTYETVLLSVGGIRMLQRYRQRRTVSHQRVKRHILIIGAGDCGSLVAKKILDNEHSDSLPAAFIDDDPNKWNKKIVGIPVVGGRDSIMQAVQQYQIQDIIIALPSLPRKQIAEFIDCCKTTGCNIYTMPSLDDLMQGKLTVNDIRHVDVEDLLGREPVRLHLQDNCNYIRGRTVLVTGAGGSIGSELCRQIAALSPQLLLLLGHGENSIYAIESELRRLHPGLEIMPIIADIQNKPRLEQLFHEYAPNVVFHAAAHKHVPLMELNPSEAIRNNVHGTRNVAECAHRFGSERFVLISSDKAVHPSSVMGATKRMAEMVIQHLNERSSTNFTSVRFGNVLGSRGSVIPRFKEQIQQGGPITITHPDMTRFFMTIPEAVALVIQAGAYAVGGEVFILDMGKPVKILDLATDLIRLSGFEPYKDIEIEVTGIRPGEKLHEELSTEEEGLRRTEHQRIFVGNPLLIEERAFEHWNKQLNELLLDNPLHLKRFLMETISSSDEGVKMAR
ncbi:polysaccharide biosynthesis protein [Paenibacillus sp. KS1]|nr:polysaccharide biosynthesis protein [Paenibacillus sp. KS1]